MHKHLFDPHKNSKLMARQFRGHLVLATEGIQGIFGGSSSSTSG